MIVFGLILGGISGMSLMQSLDDIYYIPEYIGIACFLLGLIWIIVHAQRNLHRINKSMLSQETRDRLMTL